MKVSLHVFAEGEVTPTAVINDSMGQHVAVVKLGEKRCQMLSPRMTRCAG